MWYNNNPSSPTDQKSGFAAKREQQIGTNKNINIYSQAKTQVNNANTYRKTSKALSPVSSKKHSVAFADSQISK